MTPWGWQNEHTFLQSDTGQVDVIAAQCTRHKIKWWDKIFGMWEKTRKSGSRETKHKRQLCSVREQEAKYTLSEVLNKFYTEDLLFTGICFACYRLL